MINSAGRRWRLGKARAALTALGVDALSLLIGLIMMSAMINR
jgi:hypothetical protein